MLYANVLAYNTERVEGYPSSWTDFFNTRKFPGRRGLHKVPSETLEVALLAEGVLPGDLYPLDLNRALGKLDTIMDQILWWEDAARSQRQIASGEVALISAWNGRVQTEINRWAIPGPAIRPALHGEASSGRVFSFLPPGTAIFGTRSTDVSSKTKSNQKHEP